MSLKPEDLEQNQARQPITAINKEQTPSRAKRCARVQILYERSIEQINCAGAEPVLGLVPGVPPAHLSDPHQPLMNHFCYPTSPIASSIPAEI
jgi:hypothetical protein